MALSRPLSILPPAPPLSILGAPPEPKQPSHIPQGAMAPKGTVPLPSLPQLPPLPIHCAPSKQHSLPPLPPLPLLITGAPGNHKNAAHVLQGGMASQNNCKPGLLPPIPLLPIAGGPTKPKATGDIPQGERASEGNRNSVALPPLPPLPFPIAGAHPAKGNWKPVHLPPLPPLSIAGGPTKPKATGNIPQGEMAGGKGNRNPGALPPLPPLPFPIASALPTKGNWKPVNLPPLPPLSITGGPTKPKATGNIPQGEMAGGKGTRNPVALPPLPLLPFPIAGAEFTKGNRKPVHLPPLLPLSIAGGPTKPKATGDMRQGEMAGKGNQNPVALPPLPPLAFPITGTHPTKGKLKPVHLPPLLPLSITGGHTKRQGTGHMLRGEIANKKQKPELPPLPALPFIITGGKPNPIPPLPLLPQLPATGARIAKPDNAEHTELPAIGGAQPQQQIPRRETPKLSALNIPGSPQPVPNPPCLTPLPQLPALLKRKAVDEPPASNNLPVKKAREIGDGEPDSLTSNIPRKPRGKQSGDSENPLSFKVNLSACPFPPC